MERREGQLDCNWIGTCPRIKSPHLSNKESVCLVWNRSYLSHSSITVIRYFGDFVPTMYCKGSNRGGVRGRVTVRYGA